VSGAPARPLSIYLVAAEESGDALGAALVRALRAAVDEALTLSGVSGRAMAAEGVLSPFSIDELAIVGVSAIPARLPLILRRIREQRAKLSRSNEVVKATEYMPKR
jgi:lipid-A-disaccharide synthase